VSPVIVILAVLFILAALVLLLVSGRAQKQAGLPVGRIVYVDTGGWARVEKPLYDSLNNLVGKPDYLVEQDGFLIPVEVKSSYAPSTPREGHLYQLAAYCLLVERTSGKRPPYGILRYRNRTFEIDFTPELENAFTRLLNEMRMQERLGEAERSHEDAARCARCGYRSICDERL
jgi:CRISPR-associated exonuclease Cas4